MALNSLQLTLVGRDLVGFKAVVLNTASLNIYLLAFSQDSDWKTLCYQENATKKAAKKAAICIPVH